MLETVNAQCPYCGELIEMLIDCSVPEQDYIEDCQVCCCPISLYVTVDHAGNPTVEARREDD
jgi:hypothetical protein